MVRWVLCSLGLACLWLPGLPGFSLKSKNYGRKAAALYSTVAAQVGSEVVPSIETIVRSTFVAFNERNLNKLVGYFAEDCIYEDTLFDQSSATICGKQDLRQHFQRSFGILPRDWRVILDGVAADSSAGKLGARWHVETGNGSPVQFLRGCSFYSSDTSSGLIKSGFRVSDTPFKPDDAIFNALIIPQRILEAVSPGVATTTDTRASAKFDSIAEKMYTAYNEKTTSEAVQFFTPDVKYEDTLYSKPFQGRQQLGRHLERVASQLPANCAIRIDDLAESDTAIGVRWRLEVQDSTLLQGWSRGCSFYDKDPETGLIYRGFDVTEPPAPLKMNKKALDLLMAPLPVFRNVQGQ